MHSVRNSYAVTFGIHPNELLFDSKENAENLKQNIFDSNEKQN